MCMRLRAYYLLNRYEARACNYHVTGGILKRLYCGGALAEQTPGTAVPPGNQCELVETHAINISRQGLGGKTS